MTSLLTLVVFAILVAGVVTSILPRVPGGPSLSLAGVYLYWWSMDYSEPSLTILGLLTVLVVLERASGLITPVLVARVGDTSAVTATIAGTVGAVLFFLTGTIGFIVGLVVTAFLLEYLRKRDLKASAVAALVVVLSTFTSKVVKVFVAGFMLFVMATVVIL